MFPKVSRAVLRAKALMGFERGKSSYLSTARVWDGLAHSTMLYNTGQTPLSLWSSVKMKTH